MRSSDKLSTASNQIELTPKPNPSLTSAYFVFSLICSVQMPCPRLMVEYWSFQLVKKHARTLRKTKQKREATDAYVTFVLHFYGAPILFKDQV